MGTTSIPDLSFLQNMIWFFIESFIIWIFVSIFIYFLPTIIVLNNIYKKDKSSVILLNIFLWFTFIWWLIALIKAYEKDFITQVIIYNWKEALSEKDILNNINWQEKIQEKTLTKLIIILLIILWIVLYLSLK